MQPGPLDDDVRALWQAQPFDTLSLSAAEIAARAEKFRSVITRRNTRESWAAASVIVVFAYYAIFRYDALVIRVGCALTIAGSLYTVWYMHRHGGARALPSLGLPCLAFHRRELERQRDLLRRVWRWYLGPSLPGLVVFSIGLAGDTLASRAMSLGLLAVVVAVYMAIGRLNRRGADELEREIAELPPEESPTP
jgi:hypothetical protein